MDQALFYFVNHLPHPAWADRLSLSFDEVGEARVLLGLAAVFFISGLFMRQKKMWIGAIFLAAAIFLLGFFVSVLRDAFDRPRPYAALSDVYFVGKTNGWSFPSGHAALFSVFGTFMILHFKKARVYWAAIIVLGGLSRIYQGAHYPSDVLGGWIIGGAVAWAINWFSCLLEKKFPERFFHIEKT
ncbi:MAG: phosphatase PAP2 family protein [Candidatus Omnitrophota bacterium]